MGKFINLEGQRFGFWLVLKKDKNNKSGKTQWLCECECSVRKIITSNSLRTGNSTSCGCNHAPDLTDMVFGDLVVVQKSHSKDRRYWLCKCVCGIATTFSTKELRGGTITHCGCKDNVNKKIYCPMKLVDNVELLKSHLKLLQTKIKDLLVFEETTQSLLSDLSDNFISSNESATI